MSAYQNNFIASVIHNNKPLREFNKDNKRTCIIPFDSEYSLRLKNNKNVRALVSVEIDGTDVLFGKQLILKPNQSLDLERFLTDLNEGSKFKYTSKKQAAQENQLQDPTSPDNGHIQIKFFEEYIPAAITTWSNPWPGISNPWGSWVYTSTGYHNPDIRYRSGQVLTNAQALYSSSNNIIDSSIMGSLKNTPEEAVGVTIEGSKSDQKFIENKDFFANTLAATIDIWLMGPTQLTIESEKVSAQLYNKFIAPGLKTTSSPKELELMREYFDLYIKALEAEK